MAYLRQPIFRHAEKFLSFFIKAGYGFASLHIYIDKERISTRKFFPQELPEGGESANMREEMDQELEAMVRLALRNEAEAFAPRPEWIARILEGLPLPGKDTSADTG